MNDSTKLIAIEQAVIGEQAIETVNARDLHAFLGVGKVFRSWIQDRIEQYGFSENQDYLVSPNSGRNSLGGRPSKEYYITIDMAKELSMVERNEKGKEARRYFIECERRAKESAEKPAELSRMDILRIAMDSEQASIEAEAQRDEAIATKAEIGSRREASAMATASKASRDANRLRREMGRHAQTACILAVQNLTGQSYKFHPLKKWCNENGGTIEKVEHPVYGSVNSYCAAAWSAVYSIDLAELFPISNIEAA